MRSSHNFWWTSSLNGPKLRPARPYRNQNLGSCTLTDPSSVKARGLALPSSHLPERNRSTFYRSTSRVQTTWRNTHRSTGFPPFFLVYGAEAVLPTDILHDAPRVSAYNEVTADEAKQLSVDLLEGEKPSRPKICHIPVETASLS